MAKQISLTIDNQVITAPEGMLIVDAAKQAGVNIPVFCYHPKMEPVGMCRMCLVDVGRVQVDRATGQVVFDAEGRPKIGFGPKLETACTTPVAEGMVVVTDSEKVKAARKDVLEFLLTSHPLDCPVCDKGGECPLQNLTLAHGPGESRFLYADKQHLNKRVPLGELIFLDRERCIQCGRCTRFQHDVVDDPVIGFYQRGRALEIVTLSEPGFDSIFSGNTTDICPVGALTTADFRFGARPWELKSAASICNHCPVGCNLTFDVRREAAANGRTVIKRVMPRQNEQVNEIWICDRGRFGHHYTESPARLTRPLVRRNDELVAATWDEALALAAAALKDAPPLLLAGGRLSNEALFNLRQLTEARAGQARLYTPMSGGAVAIQAGLSAGSNLGELGKGDAILVVASDLHEEAPLWWLRLKQAAGRGAGLIVLAARPTRLDKFARFVIRYAPGGEQAALAGLLAGEGEAAAAFAAARNAVVFYGSDGLDLVGSEQLAWLCAELLAKTGHLGRPNNGLVPVWPRANDQGAVELGYSPAENLPAALRSAGLVWIAGADPAGDDPELAAALDGAGFVIVQELFLTETARRADIVFPVQAVTEQEGSFTSGERRVQRFYPATAPLGEARPDYAVAAGLGQRLGLALADQSAAQVFDQLAQIVPAFQGLTFPALAEAGPQWPEIGRADLYYGGTSYDNHQGLGAHLAAPAVPLRLPEMKPTPAAAAAGEWTALPVTRLYDQGALLAHSELLRGRLAPAAVWMHPATADQRGLAPGQMVEVLLSGRKVTRQVCLDADLPQGLLIALR
ncbi:MAG TPA: NADH-quinone oxidoreductase subunit NuoG [Anaerolineaceae bacterium]|nr:NADH-quinone oxidoreductase subunit NuoG [Anaerolineaceae bacterium]